MTPTTLLIILLSLTLLTLTACQDPWKAVAQITPHPSPARANPHPPQPSPTPLPSHSEGAASDDLEEQDTLETDISSLLALTINDEALDKVDAAEAPIPRHDEPKPESKPAPKPEFKPEFKPAPKQTAKAAPPKPAPEKPNPETSEMAAPAAATACVDVNGATLSELLSLPGIGPSKAEQVIKRRPFKRLRDITKVKGIGPKTLSRLQPLLCPL